MGTEIGVADFNIDHPRLALPDWFASAEHFDETLVEVEATVDALEEMVPLQQDVVAAAVLPQPVAVPLIDDLHCDVVSATQDEFDDDVVEATGVPLEETAQSDIDYGNQFLVLQEWTSQKLMPRALTVPGMLHIAHNSSKDLAGHLSHWPVFFEQLKCVQSLWKAGRKQQFTRFCVQPLLGIIPELEAENSLAHLYTQRFSDVHRFCKHLLPILPVLRQCWNADRYKTGPAALTGRAHAKSADSEYDPNQLSALLADRNFEPYLRMVLRLNEVLEKLTHWSESCPCHRGWDLHSRPKQCRMKGKVLPELVVEGHGWIFSEAETVLESSRIALFTDVAECDDVVILERDFGAGLAFLQASLETKLDFLQRLPWILVGLAHADVETARTHAQRLLRMLAGGDLGALKHAQSVLFLHPESAIYGELQQFASGASLESLPKLHVHIAALRFIPVSERYVEGSHALVKRVVEARHAAQHVSLSRRLLQIEERLRLDNFFLVLGLAEHPLFRYTNIHKLEHWKVVKLLRQVLYGVDTDSLYPDVADIARHHSRALEQQREADPLPDALSQDNVMRRALVNHFKAVVACEGPSAHFTLMRDSATLLPSILMKQLVAEGFPWAPMPRRTKRQPNGPEPYSRGGTCKWYSGVVTSEPYLKCLLAATRGELHAFVCHGETNKYYELLLAGEIERAQGAKRRTARTSGTRLMGDVVVTAEVTDHI
eukprot:6212749-Amphidinium_carterae.4